MTQTFLLGLAASALTATILSAQAPLRIERAGHAPVVLTPEALRQLPSDTVSLSSHGAPPVRYRAVNLTDILKAAGSPVDSLRIGRRGWVVAALGSDGYSAVFAVGEIEPTIGPSRVLVAYARDGAALTKEEAPYHVVVPTDRRGTRSARMVTTIRIFDALESVAR